MENTETNPSQGNIKLKAKDLIKNAKALVRTIDDISQKVEVFKTKYDSAKVLFKKNEDLEKRVSNLIANVDAKKVEITNKVKEINSFYLKEYNPLKETINNPTTGFEASIKKVSIKVNLINEKEEKASTLFNELNQSVTEYKQVLKSLKQTDLEINSLYKNAGKSFEVELSNAKKTNEEISSTKKASSEIFEEIKVLKNYIEQHKKDSEADKEAIGKILDLVTDTGLANSFDKRRIRSKTSLNKWGGVIVFGVLLSAGLIMSLFLSKDGQDIFNSMTNDYVKFLLRLTLTSPGVFTAWFGAVQYSKEKFFLEQYEFKTATALALENYTKLIQERFPSKDYETKRFDLMAKMIDTIYKEPEYSKGRTIIEGGLNAKKGAGLKFMNKG